MNIERLILVTFFGNYLINTVVDSFVALVPSEARVGSLNMQYVVFVILALIMVGVLAWWYMPKGMRSITSGLTFGIGGFLVVIATSFLTGIAGVLAQTGSLASVVEMVPNFIPLLFSWSTLVVLGYWVIPASFVGWYLGRGAKPMQASSSQPMV